MKEGEYIALVNSDGEYQLTNKPIVRCRDCREMRFNSIYSCYICGALCSSIPYGDLDGFCAWGKRKEDDA